MTEHKASPAMTDRLLCALCGKPLSALEFVGRERGSKRLCWHWDCYEQDDEAGAGADAPDGRPLITFGRRASIVAARGDGRVGTILEGCDG
jgi:hypothetical protein